MAKTDKLIVKAFGNLGYCNAEILTKSDLDLALAENELLFQQCVEIERQGIEMKISVQEAIDFLKEVQNEYEIEILRKLNPKLTIK